MKAHVLLFLSVVVTSCTTTSPDANPMQLPWLDSVTIAEDPGIVMDPYDIQTASRGVVCFVKFKNEEYKKYIIAEPADDEEGYFTFRWLTGVNAEKLVGSSPFIDLPNGFAAVDWKWGLGFVYEPYTLLLNKSWSSFRRYDQKWTYNDVFQPEVHNLIDEYWIVGYPHLDWYFGNYRIPVNPKTNLPANTYKFVEKPLFFSLDEFDAEKKAYLQQAIKEEDKRFNRYLQQVKKLIESGEYVNECMLW